jgi:hypothetical protein
LNQVSSPLKQLCENIKDFYRKAPEIRLLQQTGKEKKMKKANKKIDIDFRRIIKKNMGTKNSW